MRRALLFVHGWLGLTAALTGSIMVYADDLDVLATRLALDRSTGEILARVRLRYDEDLNLRLHSGLVGGEVIRALYSAACLVGFSLLPTGVAVWWLRRRLA